MYHFPILSIVTLFVLLISVLFAVFLFTVKTKKRLSNFLIASYLLILSFHISTFFYGYYFKSVPLVFDMIRDQIIYLSHPLLYLYVLSSIYDNFRLRRIHVSHLTPFLIILAVFAPNFYLANENGRLAFYENFLNNAEIRFSSLFGFGVVLFYLSLIFIELGKYRRTLSEKYSSMHYANYKWLLQISVLVSFIYAFSFFKSVYRYSGENVIITHQLRLFITLVLLGFMSWIVLKGLYHPELFHGVAKNLKSVKSLVTLKKKKGITILNESGNIENHGSIAALKKLMEDQRPYLNPSLTIQDLADALKMPVKDLSLLINHGLNQNFYDFVNEYRIKEAILLLENPTCQKMTILEILYEVGFNTKSTFNLAFKKYTQVTPSSYRKMHL